ncbi:MAG: ABC transporter permease [Micromonosporaceae bacterium]|nr:ABC transporter permease [Micromonosporaceae bacterium]
MIDVLASEWLKIRTVRSTWWILAVIGAFVGLTALLSWYVADAWDRLPADRRIDVYATSMSDFVGLVAQLCLAILGVLTIASEYRTGLIRTTFTAVPARRTVLLAKAAVVGAAAFVTAEIAVFASFLTSRLIIDGRPIKGQPVGPVADHVPLLLAQGLEIAVFTLFGLGLAAVTRSVAASIAVLAAFWYMVPMIVMHLPQPWTERIGSFLLGNLAGQLAGVSRDDHHLGELLPPAGALTALAGYALVPLAAAALALRRDTR